MTEGSVSRVSETQKRERKRRAKTAAEVRAAAREAKKEEARRARIAAMRSFTIDLQVNHTPMHASISSDDPL